MGGPGRLPPKVRDENALLYISFHLPCSLSRSFDKSTGPPTPSSSLAASSALRRSSSFAASPLFTPETALYNRSNTLVKYKHEQYRSIEQINILDHEGS